MAYVGLAEVVTAPVSTGRRNRAGEELWRVRYRRPAHPFDYPVPREVLGEPVEGWLAERPRGRSRNVATFGRAVRPLVEQDLERILRLASVPEIHAGSTYPVPGDHREPLTAARERVERVVSAFERRALFRTEVLAAYDHRCSVSGLGLGGVAPTKSSGLLDAAHIRPVSAHGIDSVVNGLALTPTLHRLFDRGLFTLQYDAGSLEVLMSSQLHDSMVAIPERGVSLGLRTGARVSLPADVALMPRRSDIDFHRHRVFIE